VQDPRRRLELEVIGDVEPVGLCGSGLVDCVAELVAPGCSTTPGASWTPRRRRRSPPGSRRG
jgi:hypothetical protein